ncbi:MAG: DNA replication/repair protein RecF [Opitutaceae bacterium]|nr:DNA replication/repair protein RecF [Opitutaceae bacterium]
MLLKKISLQNYRNIEFASLEFQGNEAFFVGANGQGKSNFLEAIGYVSALRSFRTNDRRILIRDGAEEAKICYELEHEQRGATSLMVGLRSSGKEVECDGEKVGRLADHIGLFPTVIFGSADIQLIRGAPALRRRFFDLYLSSLDRTYLKTLQVFHKALQERNSLLKNEGDEDQLEAFDAQLIPAGVRLIQMRQKASLVLNEQLSAFYESISEGKEKAGFVYRPNLEVDTEESFRTMLEKSRRRDQMTGVTQRGPHRDDCLFQLNGKDALAYGSEGQQRGVVLALRFAQIRGCRERTGISPLVLADDVMGELDPVRRGYFWQTLDSDIQVFATGTVIPEVVAKRSWSVFDVREGVFTPTGE